MKEQRIDDDAGVVGKIVVKKLQERTKNMHKDRAKILNELESCIELEMPRRGLIIIEQNELDKQQDLQIVIYKLKFLDMLGLNHEIQIYFDQKV